MKFKFSPYSNLSKRAFTLSETLIALVIIGVIAAITVPTIISGTRKSEYSARLKKFYSSINQAQTRAYALGDSWDNWCENPNSYTPITDFVEKYLLPQISVIQTKKESGKYTLYLNDGTSFYVTKESCLHFLFDANGDKKPNVSGRDQYRFSFCPYNIDQSIIIAQPGVVFAYNWQAGKTREQALQACTSNPDTCSKLLMMDGWVYKRDYPHAI